MWTNYCCMQPAVYTLQCEGVINTAWNAAVAGAATAATSAGDDATPS